MGVGQWTDGFGCHGHVFETIIFYLIFKVHFAFPTHSQSVWKVWYLTIRCVYGTIPTILLYGRWYGMIWYCSSLCTSHNRMYVVHIHFFESMVLVEIGTIP